LQVEGCRTINANHELCNYTDDVTQQVEGYRPINVKFAMEKEDGGQWDCSDEAGALFPQKFSHLRMLLDPTMLHDVISVVAGFTVRVLHLRMLLDRTIVWA
jgi:hypothetical protein